MAAPDPISSRRAGAEVEVSVVVPCFRGAADLPRCLESLAHQDLPASSYEVIVVLNGPPDESPRRIDEARERWPDLAICTIRTDRAGAGRARNLGIARAAGRYVTLVDHDDHVSPGFLSTLLAAAEPGVLPLAQIADVLPGRESEADYDNYIARTFLPLAGETLPLEKHARALGFNACKLVPTSVARSVLFDEDLRSGEDLVYWYDVANRLPLQLRVTGPEATYFRSLRADSVSRQGEDFDFRVSQRLDVLERLGRRPPTKGIKAAGPVHEALVTAQTAHIARYLADRPDDRGEVLAEVTRRGLAPDVAWRELNRAEGPARELATLYAFLPFADTSALVAARRIRERDVTVDVIANTLRGTRGTDQTGWLIADTRVARLHQVDATPTAFQWPGVVAYCRQGMKVAERWMAEQGPYESLYSRAMQPPSHLLAAMLKSRHPEIHWRAEFSDPMVWNPYGQRRSEQAPDDALWRSLVAALDAAGVPAPAERDVVAMVELVAYALADEIVFTNERQMEFMLGYSEAPPAVLERVRSRARVSHHPVPPAELYEAVPHDYDLPSDRANIAYFGAFYATRGLSEVVDALLRLDPATRRSIAFHVFTSNPDALAAEVAERGLEDVLVVNPAVPYLQCLNLLRRMDVLLVNDARTSDHYPVNPYLPSKWSDYLGSGRPLWAIVEEGSVLSGMDVAHRSVLGDRDGAVKVLTEIAGRPRETSLAHQHSAARREAGR
ncbi:MAG TPA: glycosyltransferase [Nocardioides sp.]|nr:glycosyltransferase [Nocardioides sp.]